MVTKQLAFLAFASLSTPSAGRDIELPWFIAPTTDGFPDRFAMPGDTVTFIYENNHNVYIHPTQNCSEDGSILVGAEGAGSANYTFTDDQVNTTIFFACDFVLHCEFGQFISFNVVEEIVTMEPSAAPTVLTMAPSATPSMQPVVVSAAPSDAPSASPSIAVSSSPSIATLAPVVPTDVPSSTPSTAPSAALSVFDLAAAEGNYTTLLDLLDETGILADLAASETPFTIFGPVDSAFTEEILRTIRRLPNPEVIGILAGHVINGTYLASDIVSTGCFETTTFAGTEISVRFGGLGVLVNGARVVQADITAKGSVFHGIDNLVGDFELCPSEEPSASFMPSDMPSLVPSDMPSNIPSASPDLPTSSPVVSPTAPPATAPPATAAPGSSSPSSGNAFVVSLIAASMIALYGLW